MHTYVPTLYVIDQLFKINYKSLIGLVTMTGVTAHRVVTAQLQHLHQQILGHDRS